jgi:hypothetical protein
MKFYYDTEFIAGDKQRRFLGWPIGGPIPTIDLISLALVAEDGRELYLLNKDCDLAFAWADEWVREHVLKTIWMEHSTPAMRDTSLFAFTLDNLRKIFEMKGVSRPQMKWQVLIFVHAEAYDHFVGGIDEFFEAPFTDEHEFLGDYVAFDWVAMSQLFGRMVDLPKGFPMHATDLHQERLRMGLSYEQKLLLAPEPAIEHHALHDARRNRLIDVQLTRVAEAVSIGQHTGRAAVTLDQAVAVAAAFPPRFGPKGEVLFSGPGSESPVEYVCDLCQIKRGGSPDGYATTANYCADCGTMGTCCIVPRKKPTA